MYYLYLCEYCHSCVECIVFCDWSVDPPICSFFHLFVYLSTPPFIHLYIYSFFHPSFLSSIHLSIHPSFYPSIHPFIHPSIQSTAIHLFINSAIYLSIYLSIRPILAFIHPSIHLSIHLFIHLSNQQSIHLFINPSIHLSTHPSILLLIHPFFYSSFYFFLQSQEASLEHNIDIYKARLAAFGFNALVVDGHSIEEILAALKNARETKDKPTALILKTFKGSVLNYMNV